MVLWQSTITAFVSLLEQLGAFRTIQRRLLDTHHTPLLRGGTPATPIRSPTELIDTSGRRIVLVLTDGVGASWRDGLISPILAEWGQFMPVAVAHLLPQRLWHRAGLGLRRARVTVPRPFAPNRHWALELPDAWLEPDPASAVPAGAVPVPVLELHARWLGRWAQLVTGNRTKPADATVLLAGNQEPTADDETDEYNGTTGGEPSAHERVRHFLSTASPLSSRLATLLAAVPVSLPVARLVQAELVPESGPDHLAEVFTSGLLRPSHSPDDRGWDTISFDLPDAARELLLSGARRSETAHVVRVVTGHFGDKIGAFGHLRAALEAPDSTPDPVLTPETARDVAIERVVMRALSGPYLSRAGRLSQTLEQGTSTTRSGDNPLLNTTASTESTKTNTVSDTMPYVREGTGTGSESAPLSTPAPDAPAIHVVPLSETGVDDASAQEQPGPPSGYAPLVFRERKADDAPPIWGDVPPRNPIFTGRDDLLDQLDRRLRAGGTTAILPATLHGMSGIGKTQIATEYVYRHLQDYDLVWWVQAAQVAQIRAGLTALARALRLPGSIEANTAVPAVREALRVGQPLRRWLLVFDSAESPEDVRPFFPSNGPGEILITSRNPDWAGVARPLEVAVFRREESVELLRRRGPEIDDEEADALAEKLGDLPLAIAQAAAWRAETGMPVSEYLRLFDEKVSEILDTSAPDDYDVSLAAAWNVSFDELETRSPASHQLLQVCAFFAPEPISRNLFAGVRGLSISPELDAALRDPIRLGRAIRDINRFGLAKIDHRNNTLELHRLVQAVLRDRMPPQRRPDMRHGAHLLLANLDPNDPLTPAQWPRYQAILPHAYASNAIECDDPWVRQLVLNMMTFLFRWGDHQEASTLARQAFELWSEKLGDTDAHTLEAAWRLGSYLWEVGRYAEAAELNQRTLELRLRVSGENSEETLHAQANVLADLNAQGDFNAARKLSEEIHQKSKGLFGDDDPLTLTAAHRHGLAMRLTGDYRAAAKLDQDTYQRRAEVLGYDHLETFSTLTSVAMDLREGGDFAGARREQEKITERTVELFGEDSATSVRQRYNLAVARRKDGDHEGALELSREVFAHFRRRYGDDHPATVSRALGHSIDLRLAGDLQAAQSLSEQTFNGFRRIMGEHHPHTLSAALDLAVTLRLLGDPVGARQLDERTLEQFRAVLGPDHPYSIVSVINLASDLAAVGDVEGSLALNSEALDRALRVLGEDHPTTLAATANLALDQRSLGRSQEAETTHAEVMTRYRRVFGDAHPATIATSSGTRADCDIDTLPI
jgi:tetratricopeptide (TPR) repeat protein